MAESAVPDEATVETWIAAGRHAEAAEALRRRGDLARAQQLYERLWDWVHAAEVAAERGDRPSLVRLHLDGKNLPEAARTFQAVVHGIGGAPGTPSELGRVAEIYEKRHLFAEAAQAREAMGLLADARQLYLRSGLLLEAARIDETLGRAREAGLVYERFLAEEPGAPEARRAHLRLGRILLSFQRLDEAVRHLQAATRGTVSEPVGQEARQRLVVALAQLGYRDAAGTLLDAMGEQPPLDDFLAAARRSDEAEAPELRLGGRYLVIRLLGAGGMGRVYLARDVFSGRDVAVKVVAPPTDERLAVGYKRFVREAQVVSALHHPNLVGVVAFHEDLGLLAMEYLPGGTLADRLPGPLTPSAVRQLGLQLAAGLEAAHAHGVVHRDLKPANIFFAASGEAKLGDFGVAHLQELGATQTAGFIGTLAYMSPEQISGAPVSFATDVYALGVTLFQALTGRLPFSGPDFVAQHLGEAPAAPSSLRPGLPHAWDALIHRALEKDPRARHPTLESLRRELSDLPQDPVAMPVATVVPVAEPAAAANTRYAIQGPWAPAKTRAVMAATDKRLGREVLLERLDTTYLATPEGTAHLAWLRALARHGGPRLQRVLAVERNSDGIVVVFEAPTGQPTPLSALSPSLRKQLLAGLGSLHQEGVAHGSLSGAIIADAESVLAVIAGYAPTGMTVEEELLLIR